MIKNLEITCVSLLLMVSLGTASSPAQKQRGEGKRLEEEKDQPKGRSALSLSVDQVRIDVTVQTKKGHLIRGLQQKNFHVYEDKVLQNITHFDSVEAPLTVILLTEYSRAVAWEFIWEAWVASSVFVDQIRADDWIAAVTYALEPEILVDFTQNKMELNRALQSLRFPRSGESNVFDAVYDVLDRVEETKGKVAVVLISSGLDTFSKHNMQQTLAKVKKGNAVIYAVSLGGNWRNYAESYLSGPRRMDFYQADQVLKTFAKLTGGKAFFPKYVSTYSRIFRSISNLLRHQYSLSYVSNNTKKDGKFRKIKVEVVADLDGDNKTDKLKANHKEGYLPEKT